MCGMVYARRSVVCMNKILKYSLRALAVLLVTLAMTVVALYFVMWTLVNGPSQSARRLFVLSVKETSAAYFLADIYLDKDEIAEIMGTSEELSEADDVTDTSLINIEKKPDVENIDSDETEASEEAQTQEQGESSTQVEAAESEAVSETEQDDRLEGIRIEDVSGPTFNGKMIIVSDPSRVGVAILDNYGEGYKGLTLRDMVSKSGAVAGINAGGFVDPDGTGTGSIPDGIVISGGELLFGEEDKLYKNVIGFDESFILHVGNMTPSEALSSGIVEAVSFEGGPVLVKNGVPQNEKRALGGGINPRTSIGQCADGSVLLLVINGRQLDSLGATFDDLVDIMLSYGAVNAANLDGGSSALMIYDGETVTKSSYIFGERYLPNAFIVR